MSYDDTVDDALTTMHNHHITVIVQCKGYTDNPLITCNGILAIIGYNDDGYAIYNVGTSNNNRAVFTLSNVQDIDVKNSTISLVQ